jgi:formylglycine-generating enzyme required for sulfatase activity
MNWKYFALGLAASAMVLSSCRPERSGATGWAYNDTSNGGFEKQRFFEQSTPPGTIFIEGGTFTMGQVEDDLTMGWDNIPRRVTVPSFYMDEIEVTNHFWMEYVHWLNRVYGEDYPEVVRRALPDTLAWREKLAYNEPYVNYYLRHPAYRDYPVVGVSWTQANDFCKWRTDRVNEQKLVRHGLLAHQPMPDEGTYFSTQAYLEGVNADLYELPGDQPSQGVRNYAGASGEEFRRIRTEDGLFTPSYRLPTEAEWEYAALGLIGNSYAERISDRRTYPWDGHYTRQDNSRSRSYGRMNANFARGRGDYMGVAGSLNDGASVTAAGNQYPPNDYGLYNMAGNVNEWVLDVYRAYNSVDAKEFRPFRGNNFQTQQRDAYGLPVEEYEYTMYNIPQLEKELKAFIQEASSRFVTSESDLATEILTDIQAAKSELEKKRVEEAMESIDLVLKDKILDQDSLHLQLLTSHIYELFIDNIEAAAGEMMYRDVTVEENLERGNYRSADNIDYLDGDFTSSTGGNWREGPESKAGESGYMYNYGETTLVNNKSRVYKGGAWDDRGYWLSPGTRRFLDEERSSASIGFRCVVDRLGTQANPGGSY